MTKHNFEESVIKVNLPDQPKLDEAEDKLTPEEAKKLQKRIKDLEAENAAVKNSLEKFESRLSGTLVIAPNIMFDGQGPYGLKFRDGCVFIADVDEIEYFTIREPMPNDEILMMRIDEQYNHPKYQTVATPAFKQQKFQELKDGLLKSRAISTSQRCVKSLESDFGYTIKRFERDQHDELQQFLIDRHRERETFEANKPKNPFLDSLMAHGVFDGYIGK